MFLHLLLPHARSLLVLLAVAGLAWYHSKQARHALGDLEGRSYGEVMREQLGSTMMLFGLRELVVSPIAELLVFFLPLMVAFPTLSNNALLACVVVAVLHTAMGMWRLDSSLLLRDIPSAWHEEIRTTQPIDGNDGAMAYGLSALVTAVVAVLSHSLFITLGAYTVTRHCANRFIGYEQAKRRSQT